MMEKSLDQMSREELIQALQASKADIEHLQAKIETIEANHQTLIQAKDDEISHLKEQIAKLRDSKYGGQSEKMDKIMEKAPNEAEEIYDHSDPADLEETETADDILHLNKLPKGKASKKGIPHKQRISPNVAEVIEEHHHFNEDFLKEHPEAVKTGPYEWEELRYQEAKWIKVRHIIDQYELPDQVNDEGNARVERPCDAPRPLLDRSLVSPSILARFAVSKYVMYLPITRQAADLERSGINISKQNISSWLIRVWDEYLRHLIEMMHQDFKQIRVVHGDETTFPCLESRRNGGNKTTYMVQGSSGRWEEKQMTLFFYSPTRGESFVEEIFGTSSYDRVLISDAYQVYFGKGFINIPCMDHIRRGFVRALSLRKEELKEYKQIAISEPDPQKAKEKQQVWLSEKKHKTFRSLIQILNLMKKLYKNERKYRKEGLNPDQIAMKRQKEARPIFDQLIEEVKPLVPAKVIKEVEARDQGKKPSKNSKKDKSEASNGGAAPKSAVGQAAGYFWRLKRYFENFISEGSASISNARAENGMRPVALLRKNSYFFDTESGAECGAGYLSLLQSAMINGLNPERYLEYVLEQMKDHPYSADLIRSLLPYSKTLPETLKSTKSEE